MRVERIWLDAEAVWLAGLVLESQAVLVDPLTCRLTGGDEFLRANDKDDVGGELEMNGGW
jgi:hypothetical protein